MSRLGDAELAAALGLLGEILAGSGERSIALVICGGSALIAERLVSRTTQDVDIVALHDPVRGLVQAEPLPPYLLTAAGRVAIELGLPPGWLNTGPSDLFRSGLPQGFETRMVLREFGPALKAFFASRYDQIHFKVCAAVDQGPGRHLNDLLALNPTADELLAAARWSRTYDDSEPFRLVLVDMLQKLGHEEVARQL